MLVVQTSRDGLLLHIAPPGAVEGSQALSACGRTRGRVVERPDDHAGMWCTPCMQASAQEAKEERETILDSAVRRAGAIPYFSAGAEREIMRIVRGMIGEAMTDAFATAATDKLKEALGLVLQSFGDNLSREIVAAAPAVAGIEWHDSVIVPRGSTIGRDGDATLSVADLHDAVDRAVMKTREAMGL